MLSKQVQYKLLLTAAEKATDKINYARLMLLFMHFFPTAVSDYGVKFMETLLSTEKQVYGDCLFNIIFNIAYLIVSSRDIS